MWIIGSNYQIQIGCGKASQILYSYQMFFQNCNDDSLLYGSSPSWFELHLIRRRFPRPCWASFDRKIPSRKSIRPRSLYMLPQPIGWDAIVKDVFVANWRRLILPHLSTSMRWPNWNKNERRLLDGCRIGFIGRFSGGTVALFFGNEIQEHSHFLIWRRQQSSTDQLPTDAVTMNIYTWDEPDKEEFRHAFEQSIERTRER